MAARRLHEDLPDDAYRGGYVDQLAHDLPESDWHAATEAGADRDGLIGAWASERIRVGIEDSLERLGVHFDVWKSEATLHEDGWVDGAVNKLRDGGHVFEEDGATWFRSTTFGDERTA